MEHESRTNLTPFLIFPVSFCLPDDSLWTRDFIWICLRPSQWGDGNRTAFEAVNDKGCSQDTKNMNHLSFQCYSCTRIGEVTNCHSSLSLFGLSLHWPLRSFGLFTFLFTVRRRKTFHQQIGRKLMEQTCKVLHLNFSTVKCRTLDTLKRRS